MEYDNQTFLQAKRGHVLQRNSKQEYEHIVNFSSRYVHTFFAFHRIAPHHHLVLFAQKEYNE